MPQPRLRYIDNITFTPWSIHAINAVISDIPAYETLADSEHHTGYVVILAASAFGYRTVVQTGISNDQVHLYGWRIIELCRPVAIMLRTVLWFANPWGVPENFRFLRRGANSEFPLGILQWGTHHRDHLKLDYLGTPYIEYTSAAPPPLHIHLYSTAPTYATFKVFRPCPTHPLKTVKPPNVKTDKPYS